jgi:hypothetical protein
MSSRPKHDMILRLWRTVGRLDGDGPYVPSHSAIRRRHTGIGSGLRIQRARPIHIRLAQVDLRIVIMVLGSLTIGLRLAFHRNVSVVRVTRRAAESGKQLTIEGDGLAGDTRTRIYRIYFVR